LVADAVTRKAGVVKRPATELEVLWETTLGGRHAVRRAMRVKIVMVPGARNSPVVMIFYTCAFLLLVGNSGSLWRKGAGKKGLAEVSSDNVSWRGMIDL
jgi:hypothetical protein